MRINKLSSLIGLSAALVLGPYDRRTGKRSRDLSWRLVGSL